MTHSSASPRHKARETFTEEQHKTLVAIRDFIRARDISPTRIEVGEILGVSKSTAVQTIGRLIKKGYLETEARRFCNLKVTMAGHRAIRSGPDKKGSR